MAGLQDVRNALWDLKEDLVTLYGPNNPVHQLPNRWQVIARVEHYVGLVVAAVGRGDWPLELPVHGGLEGETMRWKYEKSRRKCLLLFQLLGKSHALLRTNTSSTKRDIYYEDMALWGSQSVLDGLVTQLTRLLGVPRRCLHIDATSKGLVAGSLTFLDADGRLVDCNTPTGIMVPNDVDELSQFRTTAGLILVVEKDSTFQKLIDDHVERFIGSCILLTGKGYPDVNTRLFLRRLWDELQLPPLALVDADPSGISILSVYRYGSQNLENTEHLALPQLRWIGLHPTDIEALRMPDETKRPLTPRDNSLISTLLLRPDIAGNDPIHNQLIRMRQMNCKAEIQGLTKFHPQFLTRSYLPGKIAARSWM